MGQTKIESKKVIAEAPIETVFQYLMDLNNFKELLPQDKISDWESSVDHCSFKVQGAYKIALQHRANTPSELITLESGEGSPFPFTLDIHLNQVAENQTEGFQICNAELNTFLKMMVQKPLKNLFDYIADRLAKKFSAGA